MCCFLRIPSVFAGSPSNLSFIFLWLEISAKVVISSQNSAFQSFYSTFDCILFVTPKAEGRAQLPQIVLHYWKCFKTYDGKIEIGICYLTIFRLSIILKPPGREIKGQCIHVEVKKDPSVNTDEDSKYNRYNYVNHVAADNENKETLSDLQKLQYKNV